MIHAAASKSCFFVPRFQKRRKGGTMMMSITFIESERACYATFSFPDPPFSFLSVIREK